VAGRSAQLQLMDRALPPDRPISRHVVRSTVLASLTGLLLTAAAALGLDAFRRAAGRGRQPADATTEPLPGRNVLRALRDAVGRCTGGPRHAAHWH